MSLQDAGSSPATQNSDTSPADAQPGTTPESSTDANSSAADNSSNSAPDANAGVKRQSPQSVVEGILSAEPDPDSSSDINGSEGDEPDAAASDDVAGLKDAKAQKPEADKTKDAKPTEDSDVPKEFHKHPGWQRMKNERNQAQAEVKTLRQEVQTYKQDAEDHRAITGYMDQNGLSADEVVDAMELLALRRSDPEKFHQILSGHVAEISASLGLTLPADLQARVDAGEISEVDAKALAKANATAKNATEAAKQANTQRDQTVQQTRTVQVVTACRNAANNREKQLMVSDPDYQVKRPFIVDKMRALQSQYGAPKNEAEAIALVNKAHELATAQVKTLLPQRKAVTPITSQNSRPVQSKPAPKTAAEVVANALATG